MTRRRAPTPHPALRALASIPLAGALVTCSPTRGEPPLPAGVTATVPATAPSLIAAGEILVDTAQSPQVPIVSVTPAGIDTMRKKPVTKTLSDRSPDRAAAAHQRRSSGSEPDKHSLSPAWR